MRTWKQNGALAAAMICLLLTFTSRTGLQGRCGPDVKNVSMQRCRPNQTAGNMQETGSGLTTTMISKLDGKSPARIAASRRLNARTLSLSSWATVASDALRPTPWSSTSTIYMAVGTSTENSSRHTMPCSSMFLRTPQVPISYSVSTATGLNDWRTRLRPRPRLQRGQENTRRSGNEKRLPSLAGSAWIAAGRIRISCSWTTLTGVGTKTG